VPGALRARAAHAIDREEIPMSISIIPPQALERALALRDLSDPAQGPHATQLLVDRVTGALAARWGCELRLHRAHPVVATEDNYDRLHIGPGAVSRDARYTRYVAPGRVLRTHTTAMIPPLLRELSANPPADVLLACPGLAYRRDQIDRLHTGEPHQMDLWRIAARPLGGADLREMVHTLVEALAPGAEYRLNPSPHPYTLEGVEIEVMWNGGWVEVGECGIALPDILRESGLPAGHTGLAMGLGLDRLLMLAKGIPDIRLLRAEDPRIAGQMHDLAPYRPVSHQPPIRRDLSVALACETTPEEVGDRVRTALEARVDSLEAVEVLSETPHDQLPAAARERIGLRPGQKNVLVRVVIRDLARTLTSDEANELRDEVYAALHQGDAWQWASPAGAARMEAGAE
jgi:phenylalanyl-tRNA synthetase alpha chain